MSSPPQPPAPFADVSELLHTSVPRPIGRKIWPVFAGVWVLLLIVTAASNDPFARAVAQTLTWVLSLAMVVIAWLIARAYQDEMAALARVENAHVYGHDGDVAVDLHLLLGRPMRSAENRTRALLQLAATLVRAKRYDDALHVYDATLEETEGRLGVLGTAGLKLERTMAALHSDHLYDADRGINDLRRALRPVADRRPDFLTPQDGLLPSDHLVAKWKLLELYRDVKTGHATEALSLFTTDLPLFKAALGHNVADAFALAAVAADRLNLPDQAAAHFTSATLLRPPGLLADRYPEIAPLLAKYPATLAPIELTA